MFAICIEASHSKGMGHLFRMLNFVPFLKREGRSFVFVINKNSKTEEILESYGYGYEVVDLGDSSSNWEGALIERYGIKFWINDRLDTSESHVENVLKNSAKLVTFDDLGSGARYCDLNICGLLLDREGVQGKVILKGVEYLILNQEVDSYKRRRTSLQNILVTLGGSDTYGVSIKVLRLLKKYNIGATIHMGPSFEHQEELKQELVENFRAVSFLPSLVQEFYHYDLAITGGGVTPFEANATGLPCLVIANEKFEVANGRFLHSLGSSLFLGFHENIDEYWFANIKKLDLKKMSQIGLSRLDTKAGERIYEEIIRL